MRGFSRKRGTCLWGCHPCRSPYVVSVPLMDPTYPIRSFQPTRLVPSLRLFPPCQDAPDFMYLHPSVRTAIES